MGQQYQCGGRQNGSGSPMPPMTSDNHSPLGGVLAGHLGGTHAQYCPPGMTMADRMTLPLVIQPSPLGPGPNNMPMAYSQAHYNVGPKMTPL